MVLVTTIGLFRTAPVGKRMAEFWVLAIPGTTKSGRLATFLQKCIFYEFLRRRLTVF